VPRWRWLKTGCGAACRRSRRMFAIVFGSDFEWYLAVSQAYDETNRVDFTL
jgi:hypothetical protein